PATGRMTPANHVPNRIGWQPIPLVTRALLILSEDHALEAIGANGAWSKQCVHSRTLDRLATEGMRFNNSTDCTTSV
ncbi:MAG TPA: hypothetical protein P5307_27370, partial [Pirellulaceae bacterium]|nr:hypothetical protein [Pirellulaceae bacterium]